MENIRSLLSVDKPFFRTVEDNTEVRRSSDQTRTTVIINTTVQDRHGTFIDPQGGDMENYRKNPVFLINHEYEMLAGNGADVRLDGNRWVATVNDDNWDMDDPEIVKWYRKVKNGICRMASIGFMPREIDWDYEYAGLDGRTRTGVMIRKWEMLEWSFVSVGSNPNALVTSRSAVSMASISEKLDRILAGEIPLTEKLITALSERFALKQTETPAPEPVAISEPETTPDPETRVPEGSGETPAPVVPLLTDPETARKVEEIILRKLGKA